MKQIIKQTIQWIDLISEKIGFFASLLIIFMVGMTFVIVILRYFFNRGEIWMQESVVFAHGFYFMLLAGYTLLHDNHVRIDIFFKQLSPKQKAYVNFFGSLFFLIPTCCIIFYYALPYVIDSWEVWEGSKEPGGLPGVFLFKTSLIIFPLLVLLQAISLILKSTLCIAYQETTTTSSPLF